MTTATSLRRAALRALTFAVGLFLIPGAIVLVALLTGRTGFGSFLLTSALVSLALGSVAAPLSLVETAASRRPPSGARDSVASMASTVVALVWVALMTLNVTYVLGVVKGGSIAGGVGALSQVPKLFTWAPELWVVPFVIFGALAGPLVVCRLRRLRLPFQLLGTLVVSSALVAPFVYSFFEHFNAALSHLGVAAALAAIFAAAVFSARFADHLEARFSEETKRASLGEWILAILLALAIAGALLVTAVVHQVRRAAEAEVSSPRSFQVHSKHVDAFALTPDGTTALSGSRSGELRLTSLKDGAPRRTFTTTQEKVWSVAVSPAGDLAASGGATAYLCLWSTSDGALVRTLATGKGYVPSVAFSPSGELIASGLDDDGASSIRIWSVKDGALLKTLTGPKGTGWSIAFSPGGDLIASTSSVNGEVHLWSVATGNLLKTIEAHEGCVRAVAFSPSGAFLATAGLQDGKARIWQLADGSALQTIRAADGGAVLWLAFSPSGDRLATVGNTTVVHLWSVATGAELSSLRGHGTETFYSVAFTKDGAVVAGADDGKLWYWPEKIVPKRGQ